MILLLAAFLSGVLTVLAPCVLPLLPIVLGASAEDGENKKIPFVIIGALSISIILFSLLLKVSTILIGVPPNFWKSFSGGLIMALGIITIFPNLWKTVTSKFKFSDSSNKLLNKSTEKKGMMKYVFMGFALGPVFSSCSPTYALILAIVLPVGFVFGFIALVSYTLGLALILFAIALFGQKLVKKLKGVSDPNSTFKKVLGVIFVLVGLAIISGYDKKIEAAILDEGFLNTTNFEQNIIDQLQLDKVSQEENYEGKCTSGSCRKDIEGSLTFLNPRDLLETGEKTLVAEAGYPAPDFIGLTNWINSSEQSLGNLKGKVVLVDFWTLGCINCINTHKETNKLYSEFKDEGFTVIGLHAPEFAYEKNLSELQKAVIEFDITFPVAQDNDFMTWKAYNNRYWPAFYLIDKQGNIRYTHFGEGAYEEKRQAIIELLSETH